MQKKGESDDDEPLATLEVEPDIVKPEQVTVEQVNNGINEADGNTTTTPMCGEQVLISAPVVNPADLDDDEFFDVKGPKSNSRPTTMLVQNLDGSLIRQKIPWDPTYVLLEQPDGNVFKVQTIPVSYKQVCTINDPSYTMPSGKVETNFCQIYDDCSRFAREEKCSWPAYPCVSFGCNKPMCEEHTSKEEFWAGKGRNKKQYYICKACEKQVVKERHKYVVIPSIMISLILCCCFVLIFVIHYID